MPRFVYVRTIAGIQAQIWHGAITNGLNQAKGKNVVESYELTSLEARLPIDELKIIYPLTHRQENEDD